MTKVISKKILLGFCIAIILVALNGFFAFYTFRKQSEEKAWVVHTYDVIDKLNILNNMVDKIQVSRRGFRATNNKYFLAEYFRMAPKLLPAAQEVKRLVADDPLQLQEIADLEHNLQDLLNFYEAIGIITGGRIRRNLNERTFEEQQKVKRIRDQFSTLLSFERTLLEKRKALANQLDNKTSTGLISSTVLIFILSITIIYFLNKEFKVRIKIQAELKKNLDKVEQLNLETGEKNWMLTGVSIVNNTLNDTDSLHSLINSCLNAIIQYLDLPAAGIYIVKNNDKLVLYSALGYKPLKETFDLNEGLIGQIAAKKQVLIIKDIPDACWSLESSFGSMKPTEIVGLPLWFNRELKGVIEFAAVNPLDNKKIKFLEVVSNNIAIAINAGLIREHMVDLLEQVVLQKNELESQQEELKQTNEVLQSKSVGLQLREEELRETNAKLECTNRQIEEARENLIKKAFELEAASKYKSEFLTNMSHELRTPLNSILILSNLLTEKQGKVLTSKQLEYSRTIFNSGTDLLNLINDLLNLSKIEAGKIDLHVEEVSVAEVFENINYLFKPVSETKNVEFTLSVAENVPQTIVTDRQKLEQIIKNLLANALKFTPAGGSVTLQAGMTSETQALTNPSLKHENALLYISVEDTGIGIEADKQQLIFEAFQQANGTTSRKYGGTGLGLSISKELIALIGGEMTLISEEGKGSKFTIYLPPAIALTSDEEHVLESENMRLTPGQPKNILEEQRVLVFEQKQRITESLVEALKDLSTVRVTTVDSVEEAKSNHLAKKIDCLVFDIDNDLHSGLIKLTELRNELNMGEIPVIAFIDKDITRPEELHLRKFADTIIRHSAKSFNRLAEELDAHLK